MWLLLCELPTTVRLTETEIGRGVTAGQGKGVGVTVHRDRVHWGRWKDSEEGGDGGRNSAKVPDVPEPSTSAWLKWPIEQRAYFTPIRKI